MILKKIDDQDIYDQGDNTFDNKYDKQKNEK